MNITPIRVLLIEDDPADARLIQEMLTEDHAGIYISRVSRTLQHGIQNALTETTDIVLLDLSLPDSTGVDTLLKLHSELPNLPIIILTGLDEATLFGVNAVQWGAQDYLEKSDVDSKMLNRSIRYAIERHEVEMRLRHSEQEYRSLIDDVFDTSMVAVIILDSDFLVVWCNEAAEIYFGMERENILGRDQRQILDDELCIFDQPPDFRNKLRKAYEERSHIGHFECHVPATDGRDDRWLEYWSQPIREGLYSNGRIEQFTDITDRKMLEIAEGEQRHFAEALRDIAIILTSTLDLDEVLGRILSNLDRIVPHDSATITMIEDDHLWVARQRHGNVRDTQEIVAERQLQVDYRPYLDAMTHTGEPLYIPDIAQDDQVWNSALQANVRAYLGAPILLQNQTIGFINLLNEAPRSFRDQAAERLSTFAGLAAIAIQNARLFNQSTQLAAFEERQRLSRELHDAVSQTIFTCRVMIETAIRRIDTDPQKARELLEEVHQLTMMALSEMRILVLELRPDALTKVSLKQLFEEYLQPIQERRSFNLDMTVDTIPELAGTVQIMLYRITQEALNNINKHAQAKNVRLHAAYNDSTLHLTICDDGIGFDIANTEATSLGLNIMRERAAEIDAYIEIESAAGEGTCINVRWKQTEGFGEKHEYS